MFYQNSTFHVHIAKPYNRSLSSSYLWYLQIFAQRYHSIPLDTLSSFSFRDMGTIYISFTLQEPLFSPWLLLMQWGWPAWITLIDCAPCLLVASSEKGRIRGEWGQSMTTLASCLQGYPNWLCAFSWIDFTINTPLLVSSSPETVLAPDHPTISRGFQTHTFGNNSDYFSPLPLEQSYARPHDSHGWLQQSHNLFQPVPSQHHSSFILNTAVRVTLLRSKVMPHINLFETV